MVSRDGNGRYLEALNSAVAMLWGIWVGKPDTFSSSSVFAAMNLVADEWIWGVFLFGLGACQAVLLVRRNVRGRKWMDVLFLCVWLTIALLYFLGNWYSTGWIGYAAFAASSALAYYGVTDH